MIDEQKRFQEYLRSQGLRFTPQRREIVAKVFATPDHFEADDLVLACRRERKPISRATIYRTLPLLVQSGLIREVLFGENQTHYEHIRDNEHHDHLVCVKCGKVFEFCDASIERLQKEVCAQYGFHPHTHSLEIKGYCSRCSQDAPLMAASPS